jgi:hypothetical protein
MTANGRRAVAQIQRRRPDRRAADWQRAYRARVRAGRAVLHVEADVGALGDLLMANGFLKEWDVENAAEVGRALGRLIEAMNSAHDAGLRFFLE